jgi:hypothetical protein
MPYGNYPGRVKDFKKWSNGMVDKADISNRATSSRKRNSRSPLAGARYRRRRRRARMARKGKRD